MARSFELEFHGLTEVGVGTRRGFFAAVDAPPNPAAYTGLRAGTCSTALATDPMPVALAPRRDADVGELTGELGARIIMPLIESLDRRDVRVIPVENRFFGGNVGVAGLLVGEDLRRTLEREPAGHRYLLPDVCLNRGQFLDGLRPADLPRPVEVIATDGVALRRALEAQ